MEFGRRSVRGSRLVWTLVLATASMVLLAGPASAAPPDAKKRTSAHGTGNDSSAAATENGGEFHAIYGASSLDGCDIGSGNAEGNAGVAPAKR